MPEPVQQSADTPPPSRRPMQLVGEQRTPDPAPLSSLIAQNPTIPTTKTTTPNAEFIHRAAWKAGVLGSLNVLFVILAVRAILLIAVAGAIALTLLAMLTPDLWRSVTAAVYAITVVAPIIWLSSRR